MKMRVTLDDIKQLSDTQRRRLTELWKPQIYDVAVASMCMDVENEKYDEFEFVVGQIAIDKRAGIYLYDMRFLPYEKTEVPEDETDPSEIEGTDSTDSLENESDSEDGYYGDEYDEETEETDFEMTYSRPSFFSKDECTPLLNIGQMIELLQHFDFGSADFYLNAGTGDIGCEMGRSTSNWVDYSDNEPQELCDVLWHILKTLLD